MEGFGPSNLSSRGRWIFALVPKASRFLASLAREEIEEALRKDAEDAKREKGISTGRSQLSAFRLSGG